MSNRISLDELRKLLLTKYPEDKVENFISQIKPLYDFYDYMKDKHNMTYEQVEEDSSKFSERVFTDYLKKLPTENHIKFMLDISGDIMKRYANKYDYDKSEEVKKAMNLYMEFLYLNNILKFKK